MAVRVRVPKPEKITSFTYRRVALLVQFMESAYQRFQASGDERALGTAYKYQSKILAVHPLMDVVLTEIIEAERQIGAGSDVAFTFDEIVDVDYVDLLHQVEALAEGCAPEMLEVLG
ncbi:MAG: hypothetical protein WC683_10225 [bacterium]